MDLEAKLAPDVLLRLQNPELASHFSSLLEAASISQQDTVTTLHNHILTQVHNGAIPPGIFTVWLPLVLRHDSSLLRPVLLDEESRGVRYAGIKALKRALTGKQWKENGWGAVGGTNGLREVFEVFGVWESRELARVVGASNGTKSPEKAAPIDELIQLMMPSLLPTSDSDPQTSDQQIHWRPLLPELVLLVQGCSSEFLAKCLSNPNFPSHLTERVVCRLGHNHQDLLRMIAMGSTVVNSQVRELVLRSCLSDLITSDVPWKPEHLLPAVSPNVPSGMRFFLDLIYETRINPPPAGCLPKNVLLGHLITTMELATRRKVSFRDILVLLELGISVADTRIGGSVDLGDPLLNTLIHYWALAAFPNANPHKYLDISPALRGRQLAHPSRPRPEHRDSLEALLIQVVKAIPEHQARPSTLTRTLYRNLISRFKPEFPAAAKLPLIKLLCRHLPEICIDLDSEEPSENERLHLTWDIEVLNALPCHDAQWLFERAVSIRPVEQVITATISPWNKLLNAEKVVYFAQLLNVKWAAESEPVGGKTNPMTRKLLDDVKKKAERQRDPDERLEFSQLAVDVAEMSQSVRLFKEVAEWARRFIRDPMVGKSLPRYIFASKTAPLLSCATSSILKDPIPLPQLSTLVQEANSLISFHLQTVLLALREPGFQSYPYTGLLGLLRDVVSYRIDGIRTRLRLKLESESDLVKIFLESLTPIILEFERAGTAEGQEQLGWRQINGPLNDLDCPSSPSGPVLSFLDDLANKRDELWNQVRVEREPKVAVIGKGWPKGLPVQSLLPSKGWAVAAVRNTSAAPFVRARVKEIVFCDPETVLETVPEDTDHIGPFCDSLTFSVTCYVGKKSSAGREKRLLEVWEHYSTIVPANAGHILTLGKWLSNLALSRRCVNVAKRINRAIYPPPLELQLPTAGSEAVEWDPWPEVHGDNTISKPPTIVERPTILRCQFHTSTYNASMSNSFNNNPPSWKTSNAPEIFDIWKTASNTRTLPLPTQEAILVSALLYLDSLNTGSTRLLSKSFPEGAPQARYPPVYLDYEFLSAIGKLQGSASRAVKVLRRLLAIVPPTLLRDLAKSLMKTVSELPETSTRYAEIQNTAFSVMALLPLSDKPALVVDLGLKMVKDMPNASAYHRQIISLRLGRQLGHKDAERMISEFAAFVFDALEKQRKGGKVQPEPEPEPESDEDIDMLSEEESDADSDGDIDMADEKPAPSPPKAKSQIKITTVKMLAQLLTQSNFTSLEFARSNLVSLFSASHHIDVRRAVADALLELLQKCEDMGSNGSQHVYSAVISLSPAAAGPSERVRVSEEQWLEAERGGPLPEVDTERPLFKLFLEETKALLPSRFFRTYVRDAILPLLEESGKQHNRWMRAFLNRVDLTAEEKSVTDFGPFGTVGTSEIVLRHWKHYLPKSYLLQNRAWALSHLNCRKLERVNDKLTIQDPKWRNTEEGKYWARYFATNKTGKEVRYWNKLLEGVIITFVDDGITDQDLMDEFCEQAAVIIREPFTFSHSDAYSKVSLSQFDSMLAHLQIPTSGSDYTRWWEDSTSATERWRTRMRPVLRRITKYVESIRSSDSWSKNPGKPPVILPPRMRLQVRLLPYPHINLDKPPSSQESDQERIQRRIKRQEEFLSSILALLDESAASPSCLANFAVLADAMGSIAREDKLAFILGVGRSLEEDGDSFKDCLKVQLVEETLNRIPHRDWVLKDFDEKKEFKAMVARWKKSPNEWVRSIAWTKIDYSLRDVLNLE